MKMIGLASQLYSVDGDFVLAVKPETQTRDATRRIARRKTLDGGVVITDSGFAHGDRDLSIRIVSSEALWTQLWAFFQSVLAVTVSTDDGCYVASLEKITESNGEIYLSIMLKEKIS
jgi:hypothetical protein